MDVMGVNIFEADFAEVENIDYDLMLLHFSRSGFLINAPSPLSHMDWF